MIKTLVVTTAVLALLAVAIAGFYNRSRPDVLRYEITGSCPVEVGYDTGKLGQAANHVSGRTLSVTLTDFSPGCPMSISAHAHSFIKGSVSIRAYLNGKLIASDFGTGSGGVAGLNFETDDRGRVWYPDCVNGHR